MKLFNYIIIFVGIAFVFQLAGLSNDVTNQVLSFVGLNTSGASDFQNANLYNFVIYVLGLATAGAIIIGFFVRANPENYILVTLVNGSVAFGSITLFLSVATQVITKAWALFPTGTTWNFVAYITTGIMGLLGVGFIWTLTEWFRGTD